MSTIYRMIKLFHAARSRLIEADELKEITGDWRQQVVERIERAKGIVWMKHEYYERHNRFLLGTPSQLR